MRGARDIKGKLMVWSIWPTTYGVKFWFIIEGYLRMDKKELIDRICEINKGAKAEFLARFSERELSKYLEHLMELNLEQVGAAG